MPPDSRACSPEHDADLSNHYAHFPTDCVPVRKHDALSLALASRHFREPALDALWRSMLSIKPLLNLIIPRSEAFLYMDSRSKYSFSQVMVCSQWIDRTDWSRYNYYAHRVRHIKISDCDDVTLFYFHALSICSSRPYLLPNLRFLHWGYFMSRQSFPLLPLFIGPRLTTLALDMEILQRSDITPVVSLLSTVRASCPALDELVLLNKFYENVGECNAGVAELVLSTLPFLKSVDIRCETLDETWACLAKMPNLRSLKSMFRASQEAGGNDLIHSMGNALKPAQDNFVALEHLTVVAKDFTDFMKLLASFGSPRNLKTLDVRTIECPTASEIELFAKILPSYCSLATLTTLSLASSRTSPCHALDSAPPLPVSTLFAPFLQYRAVQIFRMRCCAVELDDVFLEKVATAWPQLRSLNLYGSDHQLHVPATTLHGLIPLVKHCHHLERLLIPVANLECKVPVQELPDGGRKASVDFVVDIVLRGGDMNENSEAAAKLRLFLKELFPGWTKHLRQPSFIVDS
ncbi:hypothetical protein DENSPDRAFT_60561 [Dentipellis sp. KUC8613]|nr:hypothetical protein DENSPDRAFT_60561 [Dentipellis sp. KUC8613]